MRRFTAGISAATLLLVTGCAGMNEPLSPDFGQSVKANMATMVGDTRILEGDPVPDARVIDRAIDRYQTDNVKQPSAESVSGSLGDS